MAPPRPPGGRAPSWRTALCSSATPDPRQRARGERDDPPSYPHRRTRPPTRHAHHASDPLRSRLRGGAEAHAQPRRRRLRHAGLHGDNNKPTALHGESGRGRSCSCGAVSSSLQSARPLEMTWRADRRSRVRLDLDPSSTVLTSVIPTTLPARPAHTVGPMHFIVVADASSEQMVVRRRARDHLRVFRSQPRPSACLSRHWSRPRSPA